MRRSPPLAVVNQRPHRLLSAFLGLVIGPLADRSGYRRTLFVCLLAVVASSLSTGLAITLSVLFLAALFGAISRAAVMPVAQATAASLFMENTARRRAISRYRAAVRWPLPWASPC